MMSFDIISVKVKSLFNTDGGYSKDAGVTTTWQIPGIPFAIAPVDQLTSLHPALFLFDVVAVKIVTSICSILQYIAIRCN